MPYGRGIGLMEKEEIVKYFKLFNNPDSDGLEHFLSANGKDEVFLRLAKIEKEPLGSVELNQLLIISGLTGISYGYFQYYWLTAPKTHSYPVDKLQDYEESYLNKDKIISLLQLRWGLRRIYTDSLLYYGNITNGFNRLNIKSEKELTEYFESKKFPTETIKMRGMSLDFDIIPQDDRYLISEMACKTYEAPPESVQDLKQYLIDNYAEAKKQGITRISVKDLFEKNYKVKAQYDNYIPQFLFSAEDILEKPIGSNEDIEKYHEEIADRFFNARKQALQNTKYYLSLVNDLDVYVATSMRNKQDFIDMANTCQQIFKDPKIRGLNLRYFDPTMSAAHSHEDKGLIECLMVKCVKVLIYCAGIKDSYGKDAEAAMALSSGKPVIFYCIDSNRGEFYKRTHPLTKLVDFSTGVANGAMVAFNVQEVIEILSRILENRMEYEIIQHKQGYFKLVEVITKSDVRIQTNDEMLTKSFWNYFDRLFKE
jgi:hypothetical protein